jgi:hypothetical protein
VLSLPSCASRPAVVAARQCPSPPAALTEPEAPPVFEGATNLDLLEYTQSLLAWGLRCQADKGAVREWRP